MASVVKCSLILPMQEYHKLTGIVPSEGVGCRQPIALAVVTVAEVDAKFATEAMALGFVEWAAGVDVAVGPGLVSAHKCSLA